MSVEVRGPKRWSFTRDEKGHRTYEVYYLVKVTNAGNLDDPSLIVDAPGLPRPGDSWSSLSWINGADDWAFCTWECDIEPFDQDEGEPANYYLVKKVFTTKPVYRCQDQQINNPLLEPYEISGSTTTKRKTILVDRDNLPYVSSSGELLIGPETEVDDNDWEITISFNTASLFLPVVNSLRQHLNDRVLWGLPPGTVKFSRYSFERRLYGRCFFYYRHNMGFEIRSSWQHVLQDRATMRLADGGDPNNPNHWIRAKDFTGENLPMLALDINGKPIVNPATQIPRLIVRNPYPLGNLLLLGIPPTL